MFTDPAFWIVLLGGALLQRAIPLWSRGWFVAGLSLVFLALAIQPPAGAPEILGLSSQHLSLFVFLILGTLSFWLAPLAVRSRKLRSLLILCVLGYLALHKYLPPLLGALVPGLSSPAAMAVPVGISYFTFKLVHFLVDLGRRKKRTGSAGEFLAYLFIFPAFTAGPIERWDHFQDHRKIRPVREQWISGLTRIIVGLGKKFAVVELLLRARVQEIDAAALALNPEVGVAAVWGYLILWYLYVYLDFSAYTDLAIGSARLFGIELMENFNWPIFAQNIGDFWKRWHMTLANWCQSYVYLPMIGWTRNPYVAVFATFFVIGIWHGASLNWVLWGLYHGAGVATYLTWARWRRKGRTGLASRGIPGWVSKIAATTLTFLFVAAGFAFSATHIEGEVWTRVSVAFTLLGKCLGLA